MMQNYYSIRINLKEVLVDEKVETKILNKLEECAILAQNTFKVIFYHDGIKRKDSEKFVDRNSELLSKLNSEITKDKIKCWFVIDNGVRLGHGSYRYQWKGDIVEGLDQYINLINHMIKRDKR
tara:strand:- start:12237 stop:12605 length:369 start_codon:yes stop_codon:yes gene_type:complete